jgi:hypothetical protein
MLLTQATKGNHVTLMVWNASNSGVFYDRWTYAAVNYVENPEFDLIVERHVTYTLRRLEHGLA